MVALIGASGSGKSTLMRHLAGLMLGDGGEVRVHGQAVQARGRLSRDVRRVRAGVGVVFQQFNLVNPPAGADQRAAGQPVPPTAVAYPAGLVPAGRAGARHGRAGPRRHRRAGRPACRHPVRRAAAARRHRAHAGAGRAGDPGRRTHRLAGSREQPPGDGNARRPEPAGRHHGRRVAAPGRDGRAALPPGGGRCGPGGSCSTAP